MIRNAVASSRTGLERTPAAPTSDNTLRLARRLDWRFLLPDANLGKVGYIGPRSGSLLAALYLFSDRVTSIDFDQPPQRNKENTFDVVVMVGNQPESILRMAANSVKPGGFLYIEANGPLSFKRLKSSHQLLQLIRQGSRPPSAYVTALHKSGSKNIRLFWHWPNFESCERIIPLDDRRTIRQALKRRGNSLKSQVKGLVGESLFWSGLLPFIVPYFSIIAERSSQ